MNLSPHFTLAELTITRQPEFRAAQAHGAVQGISVFDALDVLCSIILEPIREHVGRPVKITSGYRSPALNAATPGASKTSQHVRGEAADFVVPGWTDGQLRVLWAWIGWTSRIPFGQVIYEDRRPDSEGGAWIHVSLGAPWREAKRCGQRLTWDPPHGSLRAEAAAGLDRYQAGKVQAKLGLVEDLIAWCNALEAT